MGGGPGGGSHLTNIPEMTRESGPHLDGSFWRLCFTILSPLSALSLVSLFPLPLPLSPSLSPFQDPSKTPLQRHMCVCACVCVCSRIHMNPARVPTTGRCWKRLAPPVTHLLWSDSGLCLPNPLHASTISPLWLMALPPLSCSLLELQLSAPIACT